jgi:hypothetical protein
MRYSTSDLPYLVRSGALVADGSGLRGASSATQVGARSCAVTYPTIYVKGANYTHGYSVVRNDSQHVS